MNNNPFNFDIDSLITSQIENFHQHLRNLGNVYNSPVTPEQRFYMNSGLGGDYVDPHTFRVLKNEEDEEFQRALEASREAAELNEAIETSKKEIKRKEKEDSSEDSQSSFNENIDEDEELKLALEVSRVEHNPNPNPNPTPIHIQDEIQLPHSSWEEFHVDDSVPGLSNPNPAPPFLFEEDNSLIDEESQIVEALSLSKLQHDVESERRERLRIIEEQERAFRIAEEIDRKKNLDRERDLAPIEQELRNQARDLEILDSAKTTSTMLEHMANNLPIEPSPGPNVASVVIRLSDGKKIQRRFKKSDTLGLLKDFIDTRALFGYQIPERYRMVADYPRRIFEDLNVTFEESGLAGGVLNIMPL